MTASEILRKLADMIDSASADSSMQPQASLTPVEVDHSDNSEGETMIYPLQQKLELLKKAVGVDSAFDDHKEDHDEEDCGCGCGGDCDIASDGYDDEISIMRKNAGMPVAATMVASEDNDILG